MIKKLLVIVVSLMLMTNPLIISYVSAEVDNKIPQVDSLVLNQEVYNVGDVIEVKAKITDETGVKAAKVEFSTPAGFSRNIWLNFNSVTGLWEGTYEVLSSDEAGVWTSSYMYLSDTAENYGSINPALTLTVENTGETDSEIPELIDLQINSNEFQVGDFITIKAHLKDASGVKAAKVEFSTPYGFSRDIWLSFNPASNLWEGAYQIGVNDEGGEWISTYMYLIDQLGNYGSINPSLKVNIINSGVVDNQIPEVESLKQNAHEFYEYRVGDFIGFKAEITDDSGVNAVKVELTTPSGFSRNIWLKYNAETQLWEGSYEVKSTDEPGEWTSNYMFLKDNAGNYGSINPNLKIKVVNPGDHSVPSLKNISLDKNEVTAGDSVKVSVNTTNDHEVDYLYLYYSTPNSSDDLTVLLRFNAETNAFEGVIPILSSYQSGEYSTKRVTLYTADDSVDIHYPEPLKDGGFIVNNSNAGEMIKSISISKKELNTGEQVNFNVKIADDIESIGYIRLAYYTPNSNEDISVELKYNRISDSFEGSFPIKEHLLSGEYKLWRVSIYGTTSTIKSVSGLEYQDLFLNGNFNVSGTTGEHLIKSIQVDKQSTTIGDTVNISMKASDPDGIGSFLLWYRTPITEKTLYVYMYYNPETGYFEGNIPVGVNSELGEYQVNRVGVYYPTGNIYGFTYIDTLSDGYFNVYKDEIAPIITRVNEISDKDTVLSGEAEANTELTVQVNGLVIGTGTVGTDGKFNITIPVQSAGTLLEITATDLSGNISDPVNVTVKDGTAPIKPEVNEVNDQSTIVSGKAEAGSNVEVNSDGAVLGSSTAKEDGSFTIEIPVQKAGTVLEVSATDEAGNVSEVVQVTVTDATAPNKPEVKEVNDQSTAVIGKAEAGSKVEVKIESTVVGSSIAEEDGSFTIEIPVQKAGAVLEVSATDEAGNVSEVLQVTVKDATAPNKPEVKEVNDQSTAVIGKAEAGSKVEVMSGDTVIGSGFADANGSLLIEISLQKAGVELTVFASDADGNRSEVAKITVKDITVPKNPTMNEVTDQTSTLKGTAEAGAKVEVKTGNQIFGNTVVADTGDYSITIPLLKAGTELIIVSEDAAGNRSDELKIIVKDVTSPNKPAVSEVTEKSTQIVGTAEPGAKVEVMVNQNVIGTVTVDATGEFTVNIQAQPAGTVLMITVTDLAGNESEPITVSVKQVVQNGWILKENNWFYFIDGQLVTGWKSINSKWYFFDSNGVMKTGWLKSGTKWYFLDGSGAMKTGWLKSGGKWYYLAASGEMKTGWHKVGVTWYYFEGNGAMKTGWIQSGGKWYYLYSSGAMAYNTTIGSYKLGKDGAWIR